MRFIALNEMGVVRAAPEADSTSAKVMQNLLVQIPGEASGFYLMAVPLAKDDKGAIGIGMALLLGVLALGLLVLVRWLAAATTAVKITSIIAFFIWMMAIDQGFLKILFLDAGWDSVGTVGAILALAYTTVITILGSAGKLK
jgi:hypothetical protein